MLDAALGIGTQSLGLLARSFRVTGSDLSAGAVSRARREAEARRLPLVSLVADFRMLPVRSASFDVMHRRSLLPTVLVGTRPLA